VSSGKSCSKRPGRTHERLREVPIRFGHATDDGPPRLRPSCLEPECRSFERPATGPERRPSRSPGLIPSGLAAGRFYWHNDMPRILVGGERGYSPLPAIMHSVGPEVSKGVWIRPQVPSTGVFNVGAGRGLGERRRPSGSSVVGRGRGAPWSGEARAGSALSSRADRATRRRSDLVVSRPTVLVVASKAATRPGAAGSRCGRGCSYAIVREQKVAKVSFRPSHEGRIGVVVSRAQRTVIGESRGGRARRCSRALLYCWFPAGSTSIWPTTSLELRRPFSCLISLTVVPTRRAIDHRESPRLTR